jgi:SNF2 family DNA or RNA helicase
MAELRRLAGIPEEDGEYPGRSAKREQLIEMIGDIWENGHKCLVFTNFLAAVETISTDLERAGVPNLVMTGATGNRQELVHRFQTDPEIGAFVMTLKTGGVGLNLTAADYVFIYDPWWNRAAETQAVDRTHRIGQQNPVFAYRIIAKDTIEEKMLELQQQKAELASAILSSDSEAMKALSEEDLQFLLED